MSLFTKIARLPRRGLAALVRGYQLILSPHVNATCRYTPTCSEYAIQALRKYGAVKGLILTCYRLARCHPWGGHGYDPPRWFGEKSFLLIAAISVIAGGCGSYLRPFDTKPARPAHPPIADFSEIPPPEEKVKVSVYGFRDESGQYKPSERGVSFSSVVPQGGTDILLQVLDQSGWFVPIERARLSNLLREQEIGQEAGGDENDDTNDDDDSAAGAGAAAEDTFTDAEPLLFGDVLLEGGVIGYDTNILTGGAGVRYFGGGASAQTRMDRITVYLRTVSVESGQILQSVHATKTVVSQEMSANLFRFVEADRLVEAEVGFSLNEPPTLALRAAIEEAVKNLIIASVENRVWALANPQDRAADVFQDYRIGTSRGAARDIFGRRIRQNQRPGVGVGYSTAALLYSGDYRNPSIRPAGALHARGLITPGIALGIDAAVGSIAADDAFSATHISAGLDARYYALPYDPFSPVLSAGAGLLVQDRGAESITMPYLAAGAGVEYKSLPDISLSLIIGNIYPLSAGFDDIADGSIHDTIWHLTFGLTFYTGQTD